AVRAYRLLTACPRFGFTAGTASGTARSVIEETPAGTANAPLETATATCGPCSPLSACPATFTPPPTGTRTTASVAASGVRLDPDGGTTQRYGSSGKPRPS